MNAIGEMESDRESVGIRLGALSGIDGRPVPSENLAVTGVELRATCGARVRESASVEGVKVPLSIIPFAWAER